MIDLAMCLMAYFIYDLVFNKNLKLINNKIFFF